MSKQSNECARFSSVIPFDDAPLEVVYEIPFALWCELDDACRNNTGEVGGMLVGEQASDGHARLTALADFPAGTSLANDEIELPTDWKSMERPDGFQGTWHTHPSPNPASVHDFNHLLYMIREDFWPLMIVLSKGPRVTTPSVYIGISTPDTPLLFELAFCGIHAAEEKL